MEHWTGSLKDSSLLFPAWRPSWDSQTGFRQTPCSPAPGKQPLGFPEFKGGVTHPQNSQGQTPLPHSSSFNAQHLKGGQKITHKKNLLLIKLTLGSVNFLLLTWRKKMAITDFDELHPLHAFGANGNQGEAYGGAHDAVCARDGQSQERCDELPYC